MRMVTVQQSLMKKQIKVITTMLNKVASTDTKSMHHLVGLQMLLSFSRSKNQPIIKFTINKYPKSSTNIVVIICRKLLF